MGRIGTLGIPIISRKAAIGTLGISRDSKRASLGIPEGSLGIPKGFLRIPLGMHRVLSRNPPEMAEVEASVEPETGREEKYPKLRIPRHP